MDEKRKEALSFVIRMAIKLGATLGSWLDSDMKYCHFAANKALDAMLPEFISEIEQRFRDIEQEENGYCRLCGQKEKGADE